MGDKKPAKRKKQFTLSDHPTHTSNPFLNQALEEIQGNIVKKYRSSSNDGEKAILRATDDEGNVLGHTRFVRQIEVDEAQFAKIYLNNFSAFYGLREAGLRVFGYFLDKMMALPNQDMLIFLMDEALEHTRYTSKNSIWRGLGELVDNNIIARGPADTLYYINPMVVFNGNRITFAKTYVKKKKKLEDPNQLKLPL